MRKKASVGLLGVVLLLAACSNGSPTATVPPATIVPATALATNAATIDPTPSATRGGSAPLPTATVIAAPSTAPAPTPRATTAATATRSTVATPAGTPLPTLATGQVYTDPQGRFSFIIPGNWTQVQAAGAEVAFQSPVPAGIVPAQVQRVLDQVIRAVEFLFGFTLAAGLVVLFAAISATREERAREFAIMRAVGARASLLRQVQRAELAGVGLLAGFLASVVASIVGWALARYVFEFAWTASPLVPLAGALCGAVLALAAGWWGLRGVLARPVIETLRQATG